MFDLGVHWKVGEVHRAGCLDGQSHAPQHLFVSHEIMMMMMIVMMMIVLTMILVVMLRTIIILLNTSPFQIIKIMAVMIMM